MRYLSILVLSVLLASCASKNKGKNGVDQPMTEEAAIQYQFAYEFFEQGELIRALQSALDAKKVAPNNADVVNLLGLIYFRQQKFEAAEAEFMKAIELRPKMSEAFVNLGSLRLAQKRYKEAIPVLEKALANPLYLYPERIHNNMGLAYAATGQNKEAEKQFKKAMQLEPEFFLATQNLAKLYMKLDRPEEAAPLLKRASSLCETCSEPQYHLGSIFLEQGKTKLALEAFRKAHEISPESYYGRLGKKYLIDEE